MIRFLLGAFAILVANGVELQRELRPNMVLLPYFNYSGNGKHIPTVKIQAYGGCYTWRTEHPEAIGIEESIKEPCKEHCRHPHHQHEIKECTNQVTVFPVNPMKEDRGYLVATDQLSGEELRAEINIAPLASLRISTRSRRISVGVLEDVQVFGSDFNGNDFDSLTGLHFDWKVQDQQILQRTSSTTDSRKDIVTLKGLQTGETILSVSSSGHADVPALTSQVKLVVIDRILLQPSNLHVIPFSALSLSLLLLREDSIHNSSLISPPWKHFRLIESALSSQSTFTPALLIPNERVPSLYVTNISKAPLVNTVLTAEDTRIEDNISKTRVSIITPTRVDLSYSPSSLSGNDLYSFMSSDFSKTHTPHATDAFSLNDSSSSSSHTGLTPTEHEDRIILIKDRVYIFQPRLLYQDTHSNKWKNLFIAENLSFDFKCLPKDAIIVKHDAVATPLASFLTNKKRSEQELLKSFSDQKECHAALLRTLPTGARSAIQATSLGTGYFQVSFSSAFIENSDILERLSAGEVNTLVTHKKYQVVSPIALPRAKEGRIVLPIGQSMTLKPLGGTGRYLFRVLDGQSNIVLSADGRLKGAAKGAGKIEIRDYYDKNNVLVLDVIVWTVSQLYVVPVAPYVAVNEEISFFIQGVSSVLSSQFDKSLQGQRLSFTACDEMREESLETRKCTGEDCESRPLMLKMHSSDDVVEVVLDAEKELKDKEYLEREGGSTNSCGSGVIKGKRKGRSVVSASLNVEGEKIVLSGMSLDIESYLPLQVKLQTNVIENFSLPYRPIPACTEEEKKDKKNTQCEVDEETLSKLRNVHGIATIGSSLDFSINEGPSGEKSGAKVKEAISLQSNDKGDLDSVKITSTPSGQWNILCLKETPAINLVASKVIEWEREKYPISLSEYIFSIACSLPYSMELLVNDPIVDKSLYLDMQREGTLPIDVFLRCYDIPHTLQAVAYDQYGRPINNSDSFNTALNTEKKTEKNRDAATSFNVIHEEKAVMKVVVGGNKECIINESLPVTISMTWNHKYGPMGRIGQWKNGSGGKSGSVLSKKIHLIAREQARILPCESSLSTGSSNKDNGEIDCRIVLPSLERWALRMLSVGGTGHINIYDVSGVKYFFNPYWKGHEKNDNMIPVPLDYDSDIGKMSNIALRKAISVYADRVMDSYRYIKEETEANKAENEKNEKLLDIFTVITDKSDSPFIVLRDNKLVGSSNIRVRYILQEIESISIEMVEAGKATECPLKKGTKIEKKGEKKQKTYSVETGMIYRMQINLKSDQNECFNPWVAETLNFQWHLFNQNHGENNNILRLYSNTDGSSPVISIEKEASSNTVQTVARGDNIYDLYHYHHYKNHYNTEWVASATHHHTKGIRHRVLVQAFEKGVMKLSLSFSKDNIKGEEQTLEGKKKPEIQSNDVILHIYDPLYVIPSHVVLYPHQNKYQLSIYGGPYLHAHETIDYDISFGDSSLIKGEILGKNLLQVVSLDKIGETNIEIRIKGDNILSPLLVPVTIAYPASIEVPGKHFLSIGRKKKLTALMKTSTGLPFTMSHVITPSSVPTPSDLYCVYRWSTQTSSLVRFIRETNGEKMVTSDWDNNDGFISGNGIGSIVIEGLKASNSHLFLQASCNNGKIVLDTSVLVQVNASPPQLLAPYSNINDLYLCTHCMHHVPVLLSVVSPFTKKGDMQEAFQVTIGDKSLVSITAHINNTGADSGNAITNLNSSGFKFDEMIMLHIKTNNKIGKVYIGYEENNALTDDLFRMKVTHISSIHIIPRLSSGISNSIVSEWKNIPIDGKVKLEIRLLDSFSNPILTPHNIYTRISVALPSIFQIEVDQECQKHSSSFSSNGPSAITAPSTTGGVVGSINNARGDIYERYVLLPYGCFSVRAKSIGCSPIEVSVLSYDSNNNIVTHSDVIVLCSMMNMLPSNISSKLTYVANDIMYVQNIYHHKTWGFVMNLLPMYFWQNILQLEDNKKVMYLCEGKNYNLSYYEEEKYLETLLLPLIEASLSTLSPSSSPTPTSPIQKYKVHIAPINIQSSNTNTQLEYSSDYLYKMKNKHTACNNSNSITLLQVSITFQVSLSSTHYEEWIQKFTSLVSRTSISSSIDWSSGIQPWTINPSKSTEGSWSIENKKGKQSISNLSPSGIFLCKEQGTSTIVSTNGAVRSIAQVNVLPWNIGKVMIENQKHLSSLSLKKQISLPITLLAKKSNDSHHFSCQDNTSHSKGEINLLTTEPFRESGVDIHCSISHHHHSSSTTLSSKQQRLLHSLTFTETHVEWTPNSLLQEKDSSCSLPVCHVLLKEIDRIEVSKLVDSNVPLPLSASLDIQIVPRKYSRTVSGSSASGSGTSSVLVDQSEILKQSISIPFHPLPLVRPSSYQKSLIESFLPKIRFYGSGYDGKEISEGKDKGNHVFLGVDIMNSIDLTIWHGGNGRDITVWSTLPTSLLQVNKVGSNASTTTLRLTWDGNDSMANENIMGFLTVRINHPQEFNTKERARPQNTRSDKGEKGEMIVKGDGVLVNDSIVVNVYLCGQMDTLSQKHPSFYVHQKASQGQHQLDKDISYGVIHSFFSRIIYCIKKLCWYLLNIVSAALIIYFLVKKGYEKYQKAYSSTGIVTVPVTAKTVTLSSNLSNTPPARTTTQPSTPLLNNNFYYSDSCTGDTYYMH